jgi:hypothetical protein
VILRVKKEDSAYLYQVLESYEGLTNFSTLDDDKGSPYRRIALHIAPDLRGEVSTLVDRLSQEIELTVC